MKKLTLCLSLALCFLSFEALAWKCVATSPSGWGVGHSPWQGTAANIALNECAIRTPWGQACYVQECNPYRGSDNKSLGGEGFPEFYGSDYKMKFSNNPEETAGGVMTPKK